MALAKLVKTNNSCLMNILVKSKVWRSNKEGKGLSIEI